MKRITEGERLPGGDKTPEQRARDAIDDQLSQAGWAVQNRDEANLSAARGVAIREFKMADGHGFADHLLYVDKHAVGALEAKPAGFTLSGVKPQVDKYSRGLPDNLPAPIRPLPFLYVSTGVETNFINLLDQEPRSRSLFGFHRPETLAEWLQARNLPDWVRAWGGDPPTLDAARAALPSSLRARLRAMPPVTIADLWENKRCALENLEESFHDDRPRALIQMATGSGKPMLAITSIYRLIKFGGARRVLFLVDRTNLGNQAAKEFEGYRTPDDHRKFTELYKVQHLKGNTVGSSTKVVITTIQRLYSMLKGEPEFDPTSEEQSQFIKDLAALREPLPVAYDKAIPPEFFDIIFIDECHRSIYTLWRQVLEYFDAYLIGLTATPSKQTLGFFEQNLVMEYRHEEAVADKVNVPFDVYRIRTEITEKGSKIDAGPEVLVGKRDRRTRDKRWEQPEEDIEYGAKDLDRSVVAEDQIRLIAKTFKDRLFSEIFPGRKEVPKTLIFAKDDSHAEDIVRIFRQEFGKGDDFCQKITYLTTGRTPKDLIQDFRNSFNPRIAVTVDMIATGTQTSRNCHVHADRQKPPPLRADEGARRPRYRPDRIAGRYARCCRKDAFHHRRLRWRYRGHALRRAADGAEKDGFVQGAARTCRAWRDRFRLLFIARDKASLDIFWLRDEGLEDSASLPDPHVLAAEIAEDLRSALDEIGDVLPDLQQRNQD